MKLEVVVVPVADVDRAVGFDESMGWRLVRNSPGDAGFGVEPLTAPGVACSIIFDSRVTSAALGSAEDLQVSHDTSGVIHDAGTEARAPSPAPEHRTCGSFASFGDQDGKSWSLQEMTMRLPGR